MTDETMEIIEEVAEMLLNELEGGEQERASRDSAAGSRREPSRNAHSGDGREMRCCRFRL
ncbi:MAG: hypothetical protein MZU79_03075 [Anaerotruncus sp.]|nr:hypothetical protein [Anaerotruncus sp.]